MAKEMDLQRFITAQKMDFDLALGEIENGRKVSCWMWYIFPQVRGLGRSSTADYYGIESLEEARAYLADPYLGGNLRKICRALLRLEENNPTAVFGRPDDMKLKSSMTLFACASEDDTLFRDVLEKYFGGKTDRRTLKILNLD